MPKTNEIFDNPFLPVTKVPLNMPDGSRASRSAVIVDPGGRNFEAGVVSESYNLISNEIVQDVAVKVLDQAGMTYSEGGSLFDGKKYRQRWIIDDMAIEPRVGDLVQVAVDAYNSYDGSSLFGLAFNAKRLICGNGMVIDFLLGSFRFRHFGQNDFAGEMEAASGAVLGLTSMLKPLAGKFQHMIETPINRESIQTSYRALKPSQGLQADVFMSIEEDTLYGLYNAFTNVLTRQNNHRAEGINRQVGRLLLGRSYAT